MRKQNKAKKGKVVYAWQFNRRKRKQILHHLCIMHVNGFQPNFLTTSVRLIPKKLKILEEFTFFNKKNRHYARNIAQTMVFSPN
jgi:hypothetical protein